MYNVEIESYNFNVLHARDRIRDPALATARHSVSFGEDFIARYLTYGNVSFPNSQMYRFNTASQRLKNACIAHHLVPPGEQAAEGNMISVQRSDWNQWNARV